MMKIEITKEEYRVLLDVFHIADWVLHSHKMEEGMETEKYRNLEQKFFSYAQKMGFADLVEYDPEMKEYFPTREYDENNDVMQAIVEYDNETFWEELTERLAMRDLIVQEGKEKVMAMDDDERLVKTEKLREKYGTEFEQHGISRISIKK
jgi:hypothetical protein